MAFEVYFYICRDRVFGLISGCLDFCLSTVGFRWVEAFFVEIEIFFW